MLKKRRKPSTKSALQENDTVNEDLDQRVTSLGTQGSSKQSRRAPKRSSSSKTAKAKAKKKQADSDESDTASELDDALIFDSDIQLDIHSQLAALKEVEERE